MADARFLGLQPAILDIFVHIFWSKTIILGQNGIVETKKYIWHLYQTLNSYLCFSPGLNFLKALVQNLSLCILIVLTPTQGKLWQNPLK